jgi:hypothetical protein
MVTHRQALEIFDSVFQIDSGVRTFNPITRRVDVDGIQLRVKSHSIDLHKIPVPLGVIRADVHLNDAHLTTLENGPTHVMGKFHISHNQLTSLAHAPSHVDGTLMAQHNKLTTLDAAHCQIRGDLDVRFNLLQDLADCPQVKGLLWATKNPHLTHISQVPDQVAYMMITYSHNLNLLKLLEFKGEIRFADVPTMDQFTDLKNIFANPKYAGKGKSMMLNVALELRRAGFPASNIKW